MKIETQVNFTDLRNESRYSKEDCYYVGVMIGRVLKNLDYVFTILVRLFKYYHEEIVKEEDEEKKWEKVRKYLKKTGAFEGDVLEEVIGTLRDYRMFEVDFESYVVILEEVKKVMEEEVIASVPEEVRNNPFFKEGFKKVV